MFRLNIKPLSVNRAWGGRRFKSEAYQDYEMELSLALKKFNSFKMPLDKTELEVTYKFYLVNYSMTDTGNLEKQLTDILVQNQFINDDRYIKRLVLEKYKSKKDYIEIEIKPYGR